MASTTHTSKFFLAMPPTLSERFHIALYAPAHPWEETEATLRALWHEDCIFRDPVMLLPTRQAFIDHCLLLDTYGALVQLPKSQALEAGPVARI